jgi:hypothetical protein
LSLSCRPFASSGRVTVCEVAVTAQRALATRHLMLMARRQVLRKMVAESSCLQASRGALHGSVQGCRQQVSFGERRAVPCLRLTWRCLALAPVEVEVGQSFPGPSWLCLWWRKESGVGIKRGVICMADAPHRESGSDAEWTTVVYLGSGRKCPTRTAARFSHPPWRYSGYLDGQRVGASNSPLRDCFQS